jgi:UDP-N-acetylmuramate dehydrogenase
MDDLLAFLAAKPADMPLTVIGVASNLLVRDGGIDGVVLRLARGFAEIAADGLEVEAGAAALDINVARVAAEAGIGGLEFLVGVPGTIGGAVRMNAGAYGRETKDMLLWAELALPGGCLVRLTAAELGLSYRRSRLPPGAVVTRARFRGEPKPAAEVLARMAEIQAERQATQPVRSRTGGSTFANPPGHKAWKLIRPIALPPSLWIST